MLTFNKNTIDKRVCEKGVSGIKYFYWVNPVCLHYNSRYIYIRNLQ